MNHCMALPETNEHSEDLDPEVPPHPDFDLIVLEVYLKDNRAEEEEMKRKLEEEAGIAPVGGVGNQSGRRAGALKGGRLPPMKEKNTKKKVEVKTPIIDLAVELHQLVGTFSTFSERAPASIDLGMYTWAELKEFGTPPPEVVVEKVEIPPEEMTAFQISMEEKRRKAVPEWLPYAKSPSSGELCVE
jgi:hypothetical protein